MENITVKKTALLATLKKNRDQHKAIYLEAFDNYRKQAIRELETMIDEARAGKNFQRGISLSPPVNQTRDYDRVIGMLELDQHETVELSEPNYAMYVMDDWTWKRNFLLANSTYSGRAKEYYDAYDTRD